MTEDNPLLQHLAQSALRFHQATADLARFLGDATMRPETLRHLRQLKNEVELAQADVANIALMLVDDLGLVVSTRTPTQLLGDAMREAHALMHGAKA